MSTPAAPAPKFRFRTVVFWLHLVAGLVAGVIVFVMSVTGVLLAYERQIVAWSDSSFRVEPPTPGAARMDVESLLASVRSAETSAVPSGVTLRADPEAPATVSFGRDKTLFIHPYTGAVLGEATGGWREFFHWMVDWHRWIGLHGEGRAVGKAITGACNLAFLFLVVSGVYLWFPRKWTKAALKSVTVFDGRLKGRSRDWNWHNVLGFWAALPLVFVVASAVVISYPWAGDLVYRAFGEEPPARRAPPGAALARSGGAERPTPNAERRNQEAASAPAANIGTNSGVQGSASNVQRSRPSPQRGAAGPAEIRIAGLNAIWAVAEKKVEGWNYVSMRFPAKTGDPLTFLIDKGTGPRPDLRATLTLDAESAKEVDWKPYSSMNAGQKARGWIRWIHTGEAGGWIGQTVAMLASLAAAVLVWTGFALSWRRFFGKRRLKD